MGLSEDTNLSTDDIILVRNDEPDGRDWVGRAIRFRLWKRKDSESGRMDMDPFLMIWVQWLRSRRNRNHYGVHPTSLKPSDWEEEDREEYPGQNQSIIYDRMVTGKIDCEEDAGVWLLTAYAADFRLIGAEEAEASE